jgi:hypothetical protein
VGEVHIFLLAPFGGGLVEPVCICWVCVRVMACVYKILESAF